MKKRKSLTLHVRTHKGTLTIIVLKERNTGGSDRDNLLRRSIDIIAFLGFGGDVIAVKTSIDDIILDAVSLQIDVDVRLADDVILLFIRGEPSDIIRIVIDDPVLDRTVRSL